MAVDQTRQDEPATTVERLCLRVFGQQRLIPGSDHPAVIVKDQHAEVADVAVGR